MTFSPESPNGNLPLAETRTLREVRLKPVNGFFLYASSRDISVVNSNTSLQNVLEVAGLPVYVGGKLTGGDTPQ